MAVALSVVQCCFGAVLVLGLACPFAAANVYYVLVPVTVAYLFYPSLFRAVLASIG